MNKNVSLISQKKLDLHFWLMGTPKNSKIKAFKILKV